MFSFFFRNVTTYVRFSFFLWTENNEKKKEKKICILTFNFSEKMKNNKSVVNFQ